MERVSYEKNKDFIWRHTVDDVPREPSDIMHYDNSMVITYLVRGKGNIFVENSHTDISEGDIIIVSPNEFHRTYFGGDPTHERITVYVMPSLAETVGVSYERLFGVFFDRKQGRGNVIPANVAKEIGIHALFESMRAPEEEDDGDGDILLQCKIVELLITLKRALPLAEQEPVARRESKTTSAAISYINEHLSEELSTGLIADALFLDRSYLCREFKKNTGATVNQYITKKRIFTAIELMAGGVSCTDACYRSGFGNYSSFYKYYRRYTDASPADTKIKKTAKRPQK